MANSRIIKSDENTFTQIKGTIIRYFKTDNRE